MYDFVNRLFAPFGLVLAAVSEFDALRNELEASRAEREALERNLRNARHNQEVALSDLYALRVRTDPRPPRNDPLNQLSVVVPTMNSERYIELILKYYQEVGVSVHVLVDSKTTDATFEIAKRYAPTQSMENSAGSVTSVIEEISKRMGTEWVLRLDDDEVPSRAMLDFVYKIIAYDELDAIGFPRHQCAISKAGDVLVSREYDSRKQLQWRLYRPQKVDFVKKIHSPGFRRNRQRSIAAPPEAFIIHLDWSLHSYEERQEKIDRYERHAPGSSNHWRPYYLFEENPHKFGRLSEPEFGALAKGISERLSDLCVQIQSTASADGP